MVQKTLGKAPSLEPSSTTLRRGARSGLYIRCRFLTLLQGSTGGLSRLRSWSTRIFSVRPGLSAYNNRNCARCGRIIESFGQVTDFLHRAVFLASTGTVSSPFSGISVPEIQPRRIRGGHCRFVRVVLPRRTVSRFCQHIHTTLVSSNTSNNQHSGLGERAWCGSSRENFPARETDLDIHPAT